MRIERYKGSRFWALYDEQGALVCVTVYRKGAMEVKRRLQEQKQPKDGETDED